MFYTFKSRLMVTFSMLIIVPFVIMVLMYSEQSKSNVEDILHNSAAQTMGQYAVFIETLSEQIEDVSNQLLGSERTQTWIQSRYDPMLTMVEQYRMNAGLREYISAIALNHSNISSITLFDENGFAVGTDSVYQNVRYPGRDWFAYVKENGPGWVEAHYDPYQPYHLQKERINSYVFPLVELESMRIRGAIKINFATSLIREPLEQMRLSDRSRVYLSDPDGTAVMSGAAYTSSELLAAIDKIRGGSGTRGVVAIRDDGENYLFFFQKLHVQDWILIGKVAESDLYGGINETRRMMLFVSASLLLVAIAAAVWLSAGIARPLSGLSQAMKELEKGNLSVRDKLMVPGKGEIGYVIRVFNRMVKRLNHLIQEEFHLNLRRKDAEYKALLMQINPHFLYNTLEVIGSLAAQSRNEEVLDVTESLGQMLRYSLRLDSEWASLGEELDYVRHYVTVMETRFGDRLKVEMEIEPSAHQLRILKFLLQPIVENAVKYSQEYADPARIRISVQKQDSRLRLSVGDSGPGMSDSLIRELLEYGMREDAGEALNSKGKRIGLRNVLARCRLYYGDRFEVDIRSRTGEGTEIHLTVPVIGGT